MCNQVVVSVFLKQKHKNWNVHKKFDGTQFNCWVALFQRPTSNLCAINLIFYIPMLVTIFRKVIIEPLRFYVRIKQ